MDEMVHEGREGKMGRDGVTGRDGRDFDSGYMRSQFEQIQATLCDLKPMPLMISEMRSTLKEMVDKVSGHDVTLYGEKTETGLVGRVNTVESRINQLFAGLGVVGSAFVLWVVARLLNLIR